MTDIITSGTWDLGDKEKQRLQSAMDLARGERILDIGTRDGTFALTLAKQHPEMRIEAIDINAEGLEWANKKAIELGLTNVIFYLDDILQPTTLPPLGQYDTVFLMETLEHLPPDSVSRAHDNALAHLKPGGRLVVSVPANSHISDPDHKGTFWREQFHGHVKWSESCPYLWLMFYVDKEK